MKIIEILADGSYLQALQSVAERHEAADYWVGPEGKDGRHEIRFLVSPEKRQETLDALQAVLGNSDTAKWFLLSVEAPLPRREDFDFLSLLVTSHHRGTGRYTLEVTGGNARRLISCVIFDRGRWPTRAPPLA